MTVKICNTGFVPEGTNASPTLVITKFASRYSIDVSLDEVNVIHSIVDNLFQ